MIKWDLEGKNSLWLLTIEEYNKLPNGIILECIDSTFVTKGIDDIDLDTRGNHIAFGIRNPFEHEHKNLFLTFALQQ